MKKIHWIILCLFLLGFISYLTWKHRTRIDFLVGQPYEMQFGRGSGMSGLETIKLDENQIVTVHCRDIRTNQLLTTNFSLSDSEYQTIAEIITMNSVHRMRPVYSGNLADGTQWIFYLKQGNKKHSIYFDNNFPSGITKFAEMLDNVIDGHLLETNWTIPKDMTYQDELWESIK